MEVHVTIHTCILEDCGQHTYITSDDRLKTSPVVFFATVDSMCPFLLVF